MSEHREDFLELERTKIELTALRAERDAERQRAEGYKRGKEWNWKRACEYEDRADRAEAEAGALRAALEGMRGEFMEAVGDGMVFTGDLITATNVCAEADAALAPGSGARALAVVQAARVVVAERRWMDLQALTDAVDALDRELPEVGENDAASGGPQTTGRMPAAVLATDSESSAAQAATPTPSAQPEAKGEHEGAR